MFAIAKQQKRSFLVVFYNLHNGGLNNVCYKFNKNSADKDVSCFFESFEILF